MFQNVSNRSKVFQNVSKNEFYSLCKSDRVRVVAVLFGTIKKLPN